jgi:voltage-gated potassium channel
MDAEPSAGARRRAPDIRVLVHLVLIATGLAAWYVLAPLRRPPNGVAVLELTCGLLAVALFVAWQARAIATSAYPGVRAAATLVISFCALIVLFATTYLLLAATYPNSFSEPLSRIDGIYFAITIFTTTGFGDLVARSQTARILVTVQMLTDLVFVGLAVRVIVGAARGDRRWEVRGQER